MLRRVRVSVRIAGLVVFGPGHTRLGSPRRWECGTGNGRKGRGPSPCSHPYLARRGV
jgi:hypothetical protein